MSITFTITATNDITSFDEINLSPNLSTTLTINSITDTERPGDTIANNSFRFEWYIVDKPTSSNASIVLAPNDTYKSSITFNSIDTWGTYRVFVTALNLNSGVYSEVNLFVAPESHFINLSVKSTNNNLEKPAATQRDWNTIYSNLTEVVDNSTKKINQIKVDTDKTFVLPIVYGTPGQVLTTGGDGSLSWQTTSGGGSLSGLTSNSVDTITLGAGYNIDTQLGTINDVTFNIANGSLGQALVSDGSNGVSFQSVTQAVGADSGSATLTFGGGRTLNIIGGNNVTTSITSDSDSIDITVDAAAGGGGGGISNLVDDASPQLGGDLDGQAFNITTTGQIKYRNVFATEGDLPNAATYHGMFAHVHATEKAYFSHGGNWIKLIDETSSTTDEVTEGSNNLYFTDARADIRATLRVQAANLETLNNVNSNISPTNGQVLKWDNANGEWDAANENVKNYTITANGSSAYRITGPGLDGSVDNPNIYLTRGENYSFINSAGAAHPFNIQSISGVAYSTTGTGLSDSSLANGESATWEVAMNAPSQLRYQCSNHAAMLGNIYILDRASSSGTGLNNWAENANGHFIPGLNASYDIGSAENKVRHLFLSDNSLNIGDANLSLGINDQMVSTSNNKSLDLNVSSISLKNYKFSNSQINPDAIISGTLYKIGNPGSIDFKLVGAKNNEPGHIFEATSDGTALTNDGVAYLNQSEETPSNNYIYVQTNDSDSNKVDLKYRAEAMSKNIVAVNASAILDNSIISYNSGEWQSQSIHDITHKSWHASHSDEWTTSLPFVASGSKYASQTGALKYIFSFKNNTGNSLVIKKITLTCNEMYSQTIKWSASFATNAEFLTNQSETLPAISSMLSMSRQNDIDLDYGNLGIGYSEWNDNTYNQNNQSELPADYFLLISINDMSAIYSSYSNKKFTATVYYA